MFKQVLGSLILPKGMEDWNRTVELTARNRGIFPNGTVGEVVDIEPGVCFALSS